MFVLPAAGSRAAARAAAALPHAAGPASTHDEAQAMAEARYAATPRNRRTAQEAVAATRPPLRHQHSDTHTARRAHGAAGTPTRRQMPRGAH
eukprot:4363864-Prymnesium_polylepis.1